MRPQPDGVILLERRALGRCTDSLAGETDHPTFAPLPDELHGRLVWRVDDTQEVVELRLAEHEAAVTARRPREVRRGGRTAPSLQQCA